MYPPDEEAGPSTSGEPEEPIEDQEQPAEDEPQDVKPQFTQPTPPPPPALPTSPQHLQLSRRIKTSPEAEEEGREQPAAEEPQPELKPDQPPAKKPQGVVTYIGPDRFLHLDREWKSLRHPQIAESSLRIQQRLLGQLESIIRKRPQNGGKDSKPNKEELKKMLMEMTRKLGVLEVATSTAKAVASQQGYQIFSIMGKSRPPEEKPLLPPRRLQFGRKKGIGLDGIGGGTSSVLSPKPEMDKTPKRTPVVPIRKPLNQPPLIQTPIPMYPESASPPIDQNHYDPSDLPNGNENHDDTPITPPLALNKGKRKAASTLPLSAQMNSIGEKPEKRPKKVEGQLKKRTSNRLSKPRVQAKEEDEPTYCFCSRVSFGEMIGCDNDKCEIEWFHFECIGLTTKPKGKWFCPNCRHPDSAKMPKTAPLPKIIKELKREMIVPEM